MKKETSWGEVAEWYDNYLETDKDSYQEKVIAPNLIRLLDIKKGMHILDLACGQGFFSRKFVASGATVSGVDISSELIANAKSHSKSVTYYTSPAHKLPFIKSGSIDAVTVVLAIQNIENISDVFKEVHRVLKPNGKLLLVMNHPAFRIPKQSSWGWDEKLKVQYRRIDAYLSQNKSSILMHPGSVGSESTITFHRSLQDFSKALFKEKFTISKLEEWVSHKKSEPGPRQKTEDTIRKEIPMFLMIEASKIMTKTLDY
jgi:ubiquinone/menaquinone biosynthesis C-methylase UbiE